MCSKDWLVFPALQGEKLNVHAWEHTEEHTWGILELVKI